MTGRTNSLMHVLLFLIWTTDILNHSFAFGFSTSVPQSSASSSTAALFSSTDTTTRKKRKTRFHYYKKTTTPASFQKQKSLIRGNHPLLSLNLNLDSLAKSGAPTRAQELLLRIEALHEEGYYAVAPDTVSYNSVLNAWARSTASSSADRAVDLINSMRVNPNLVTYNTLILAFAKRGLAQNAEAILRAMMQESSTISPDTISFNTVLYAWASLYEGEKAECLLKEMMTLALEGNYTDLRPDTISFNTVLHAYRYNPQRARLLLNHMEKLHEAGNEHVEPDVYSYTSVIQAWACSSSSSSRKSKAASAFQAKQLLEKMERICHDQQQVTPNIVSYTCVMSALSKSKERGAAQEAHNVLERMLERYRAGDENLKPDTIAFSTVIQAWANDDDSPHAAQRALDLLEQMKFLSQKENLNVAPNALTYTSVIRALGNSRGDANAATIAQALLEEIRPQPSTIHYNAVINAHARSPNREKAECAWQLMQTMKAWNVTIDIITQNSVLGACANTHGGIPSKQRQRALQICNDVYSQIRDHEATPVTYFFLFKALRKLVPPGYERWSMIQGAFDKCCRLGLLNEQVLGQLRLGCTEEQYRKLFNWRKME